MLSSASGCMKEAVSNRSLCSPIPCRTATTRTAAPSLMGARIASSCAAARLATKAANPPSEWSRPAPLRSRKCVLCVGEGDAEPSLRRWLLPPSSSAAAAAAEAAEEEAAEAAEEAEVSGAAAPARDALADAGPAALAGAPSASCSPAACAQW